ncbi:MULTISPECIES: adenylate/guanylate cyclase domain-containing protein [unclassified Moraxella]|uniref:adenylate/guanylate cyclase domain-containing protein n=1 Tax=unclassified Moraxella TaxID=2685852 RepID=UPI003AF5CF35
MPRHFLTHTSVLVLLAITSGMLQFNFLPSVAIWLMIFSRLMISPKPYLNRLIMTAVPIAVLTLLSTRYALPALWLTEKQQSVIEFSSICSAIIVIGLQVWRLIARIHDYQIQLNEKQYRIETLVSITNKLTRFVPPQIWQPIIKTNSPVAVVNQRRKLTILFSDIVGFTDLSDTISPDHLANILNTYFDRMTQITLKYGATLDKFLGDGLLCYFGDSQTNNERDNAILCINMAIDMRREMGVLRQQWRLLGFEGLYVRFGINTGYCYVGNFGSRNRMAYTVIGKEANFASRLESAAQKNQILISESTYHLVSHVHNCQYVGEIRLKGLHQPMKVWEVLDPQQNQQKNDWVGLSLPGFNLHLNFQDIRNYDRRTILTELNNALELVEKKKLK